MAEHVEIATGEAQEGEPWLAILSGRKELRGLGAAQ
jgi:hypothetical protein